MAGKDFLSCIGSSFYTQDEFVKEAGGQGISRRIPQLPRDLVLGESRIYCAFETHRDSAPRKCGCGAKLGRPVRVNGVPQVLCGECFGITTGKARDVGKVVGYFVPQAVDVVVRVSDEQARDVAKGYVGLAQLDGGCDEIKLVEDAETLKVEARVREGQAREVLETVAALSSDVDVDLLAPIVERGGRLVFVARERARGCGFRRTGSYVVSGGDAISPFVEIDPIPYTGSHFRSLRVLTDRESSALRSHPAPAVASFPLDEEEAPASAGAPDAQALFGLSEAA